MTGYGNGITAEKVARWERKGRGRGRGSTYLPWIMANDVPSHGLTTRDKGWKTGRPHHVLSNPELHYLYCLEWSPVVVDIREQYPLLPLERTIDIAKGLGVKHPADKKTQEPIVMTTDFLLDVTEGGHVRLKARTVKPEQILSSSSRVLEKFEIERVYWEEKGVDWGIVTDREIPEALAWNVELLHASRDTASLSGLDISNLLTIEPVLFELVSDPKAPLSKAALESDERLGFKGGMSLRVVKHLLANRLWSIDMGMKIDTAEPLHVRRSGIAVAEAS